MDVVRGALKSYVKLLSLLLQLHGAIEGVACFMVAYDLLAGDDQLVLLAWQTHWRQQPLISLNKWMVSSAAAVPGGRGQRSQPRQYGWLEGLEGAAQMPRPLQNLRWKLRLTFRQLTRQRT